MTIDDAKFAEARTQLDQAVRLLSPLSQLADALPSRFRAAFAGPWRWSQPRATEFELGSWLCSTDGADEGRRACARGGGRLRRHVHRVRTAGRRVVRRPRVLVHVPQMRLVDLDRVLAPEAVVDRHVLVVVVLFEVHVVVVRRVGALGGVPMLRGATGGGDGVDPYAIADDNNRKIDEMRAVIRSLEEQMVANRPVSREVLPPLDGAGGL